MGTASADIVVVFGATGGTGRHIVRLLLERRKVVRVVARNAAKVRQAFGDRVEVAEADVTRPQSLRGICAGTSAVIYTVGVKAGRAGEDQVKAVEFDGTLSVMKAAAQEGFDGRFLYMSAIGTTRWSPSAAVLNLVKGNTLKWRARVERQIRDSGLNYTIIRAGVLVDRPGGQRQVRISQKPLPMSLRYRISRKDAAEVFVRSLDHPNTGRATFDVVWGGRRHRSLDDLLAEVSADT